MFLKNNNVITLVTFAIALSLQAVKAEDEDRDYDAVSLIIARIISESTYMKFSDDCMLD